MTTILATYRTRHGHVAAAVKRHVSAKARISYSWIGKMGAASGGLEHVRQSVLTALKYNKFVTLESGTAIEQITDITPAA